MMYVSPSTGREIKAVLFDTFGSVVDWRSGVARDVTAVAKRHRIDLDAPGARPRSDEGPGGRRRLGPRVRKHPRPQQPVRRCLNRTLAGVRWRACQSEAGRDN